MIDQDIQLIKDIIEQNKQELINQYKIGFSAACYNQHSAGINKAWSYFTNLIPVYMRENLDLQNAMIFNSEVKSILAVQLHDWDI